jgi:hypothetical protein
MLSHLFHQKINAAAKNITDFHKGKNLTAIKDSKHRQLYLETV